MPGPSDLERIMAREPRKPDPDKLRADLVLCRTLLVRAIEKYDETGPEGDIREWLEAYNDFQLHVGGTTRSLRKALIDVQQTDPED